jgi:hypothetical protein
MCRVTGTTLEYLSLADSAVLHARPGRPAEVFLDDRTSHLPGGRPYTYALVRSQRNQPGGFWVASTDPKAAYQAVQGSCELAGDSSVLLLTDGVTRLVDFYGQTWDSLAATAASQGPGSLITAVRQREDAQPPPYGKQHDDATAIHITAIADNGGPKPNRRLQVRPRALSSPRSHRAPPSPEPDVPRLPAERPSGLLR